jgi:hemerythrin
MWNKQLETGIEKIDEQHKELVAAMNDLLNACWKGRGKEEIERILRFLGDYTKNHFGMEEEYMRTRDYPDYSFHRARHAHFLRDLAALRRQFEKEGASADLVMATRLKIIDWFLLHVKKEDMALGRFLAAKRE